MRRGWRWLLQGVGLLALMLGLIGIPLPGLPTTPFLLLAAFCFAKANPEWERRLMDDPRTGPALRAWRERRAIPRRAKRMAIVALVFSAAVSWLTMRQPWAHAMVMIVVLAGVWIWTRPDERSGSPAGRDHPGDV